MESHKDLQAAKDLIEFMIELCKANPDGSDDLKVFEDKRAAIMERMQTPMDAQPTQNKEGRNSVNSQ